ncbi:DUF2788 domain-containing protein [Amphritea balenae]|uniref:DUF2788 domain-containing protein n=1 Tax=Amphritea balenae TaxID=452629 RepID=A0A3P1SV76_9GAMM|nr:DUF2788 domain-containing protein [Amphritea balenae]RRD00053.1 DUF2788 domain-containing protein [Amphritea balenae]GGK76171.1 hypothetical protein GCM10007941_27960 [Amphritea balenae]
MRLAEMESIAMTICITIFAGYIFFIIYDLAKKSNAGKFGTAVLFFALGLGLAAFLIKSVVVGMLEGA